VGKNCKSDDKKKEQCGGPELRGISTEILSAHKEDEK
jgi:hypothetical protein